MSESNYQWPCWFCKLGLDQVCLKPRSVEYGPVSVRYTCNGHRLLKFTVSGSLVRSIAALLNRVRNQKG